MSKYLIFSNHCAGWLMTKGFVLQEIGKRDKGERQLNVYIFNESEELKEKLKLYKQECK